MRTWARSLTFVLIAALLLCLWSIRHHQLALRAANEESLERAQRIIALQNENAQLSNRVVRAELAQKTNAAFNELLKLRGEIGSMRREVESLRTTASEKGSLADRDPKLAQALAQSKLTYAEEILKRANLRLEHGVISNEEYARARADYDIAVAESTGDTLRIREIKAVLADTKLIEAENRRAAGLISNQEYEQTKFERNVAAAELSGDRIEAARVKLEAADARLRSAQARREAGLESEDTILRAKLERDTAAAEHDALLKLK